MAHLAVLQSTIVFCQMVWHVAVESDVRVASLDSSLVAIAGEVASGSAACVRWHSTTPTDARMGARLQVPLELCIVYALPQLGVHGLSATPLLLGAQRLYVLLAGSFWQQSR